MRTPFVTHATAVGLALATVLASYMPAHATQVAQKPADVVTVGATAHPDAQPADPHPPTATRATGFRNAAAHTAPTPNAKPHDTTTSLPPDATSLSAAQRTKLAQRPEPLAPLASANSGGAKSGNLSTIERPAPCAPQLSPETLAQLKTTTGPAAEPVAATRTPGAASVLGVIPRPEWSTGITSTKPAEISTTEAPASGAPRAPNTPPSVTELQRRAATTSASHEAKARETSTTLPRDPALPPAGSSKPSSPSNTTQEVQK